MATIRRVFLFAAVPALTLAALALAACTIPMTAQAQARPERRPVVVTDSAIARGREVFRGPANCVFCHGKSARGTERGPSLADSVWIHGKGTYREIVDRVIHGQSWRNSSTGRPMPMRGWSPVSDDEVRAVAAYVWSLSHLPARNLR